MTVLVCPQPGELEIARRNRPERGPGEVLIRIRRVGMCGTDYHIFSGTQPYLSYPRIFGHELSGEVVDGDEGGRFFAGQIVSVMPYMFCGECVACRRGKTNCCRNIAVLGVHRDGGMAEYLSVDARYVLDATGLSLDEAAMVEFLAIGHHAVARGSVTAGQRVLVVGAGPIGLAVTVFAREAGGEVTVLDGNAARAAFAVERLGVRQAIALEGDTGARLAEVSAGEFFDVVFDATGNARAMAAGFAYVAHGGAYVLVSIVPGEISFDDPEFHKRETTLLGSRNATVEDFRAVIAAMRDGRVPTRAFHTHSAPLPALPERLPEWMRPEAGVIKAIVEL
ncbi:MAG: dehydrogenase [Sphingomonas sp.]|nr:MAG: dehydrogenase [Sphingomonas sp.]